MSSFGAIFVTVVLFLCATYVACEKAPRCELAAFVENPDGSDPVLVDAGPALAEESPDSCEEGDACARIVQQQVVEGTQNGNLSLVVDEQDGYTVGDVLCDKAEGAVGGGVWGKAVRIHWRLCGSGWTPTGYRMPRLLCCEDGLYVPCERPVKAEL